MDIDHDSDTESEFSAGGSTHHDNASVAGSATTYTMDASMRSGSPVPSVISMTDDLLANAYRHEHGRVLNNYSDVYSLPADQEELERLDRQHPMLENLMGGKYAPAMAEVMADDVPGETKTVLDLGCGSGSWILDVVRDFPHCQGVAVDLIPMQIPDMPPNLRSEVDDINLGLEHFYGDFNVVHVRLVASGVKDYHRLVDQIGHVLRPGGLIHLVEFDFHMYDRDLVRFEYDTVNRRTACTWWISFVGEAMQRAGADVNAANHIYEWVTTNPAFEQAEYREFYVPAVRVPDPNENLSIEQRRLFQTLREDLFSYIYSTRPLLRNNGLSEEFVDDLFAQAVKEVEESRIHHYSRIQVVFARKKKD